MLKDTNQQAEARKAYEQALDLAGTEVERSHIRALLKSLK